MQGNASQAKKGKGRGELEFENQIAMALMASAAVVAPGKSQGVPADMNSVGNGSGASFTARWLRGGAPAGRGTAIAKIGSGRGWAQGDYQAQVTLPPPLPPLPPWVQFSVDPVPPYHGYPSPPIL